jgi:tetratricopeptide (TPR) repeat protein
MIRPVLLVVLSLAAVLATPAVALADDPIRDPEARAAFERGLDLFKDKQYQRAIDAFQSAYEIDPDPRILFAWAQAERLSGDCASAVVLYEKFLAARPKKEHAELANENLTKCHEALGTRPDPDRDREPPPREPVPEPVPEPSAVDDSPPPTRIRDDVVLRPVSSRRVPWTRDTVGHVLTGVGVAGLAVGATFLVLSSSDLSDADSATDLQSFDDATDRAMTRRTIGVVALATGGAVLAAGVVHYLFFRPLERAPRVAVVPTTDGSSFGVAIGGRF